MQKKLLELAHHAWIDIYGIRWMGEGTPKYKKKKKIVAVTSKYDFTAVSQLRGNYSEGSNESKSNVLIRQAFTLRPEVNHRARDCDRGYVPQSTLLGRGY